MELLEGDIIFFFPLLLFMYLAALFLKFSILGNLMKSRKYLKIPKPSTPLPPPK